jgi:adenylate cyclase
MKTDEQSLAIPMHVQDALKARELTAERRINWVRMAVSVSGVISMIYLLQRATEPVSPEVVGILTVPPLLAVVFVWRFTDRYRAWMKYAVVTSDVVNTMLFFAIHDELALMSALELESLDSACFGVMLIIIMCSSLRFGARSVLFTTALVMAGSCFGAFYVGVPIWVTFNQMLMFVCAGGLSYAVSVGGLRIFIHMQRRQELTRFLPDALVESIDRGEVGLELGGVEQTVTVLMSDLRGFTALSEGRSPTELVELLNEYFGAMTKVIFKNGGTIDKFIGDAVLAVFGAPRRAPDDAKRAVRAAVEMQHALDELNDKWKTEGRAPLAMGIGLHTGEVVAGNVGSRDRMDYTVIGDAVNVASRIEGLTKQFDARILLSETTAKLLDDDVLIERVGETAIRGRQASVNLYSAALEQ